MNDLTFERHAELVYVDGQSGAGKTLTMRLLLNRQVGNPLLVDGKWEHPSVEDYNWSAGLYPRRKHIIIDPGRQFAKFDEKGNHAPTSLHRTRCVVYSTRAHIAHMRAMWDKAPIHVIQAPDVDLERDIIPFCMEAGGLNLWIDEVDDFVPKTGELNKTRPLFYELFHRSRHFGTSYYEGKHGVTSPGWNGTGCGLVVSARRLANVHCDIIAKMSCHCLVRNESRDDTERLAREIGFDKAEFCERISNLEIPDFVRFDRKQEVTGDQRWDLQQLTDPG